MVCGITPETAQRRHSNLEYALHMRGRPPLAPSAQLPNRIRETRERRGWSVRELAERVGLHERDVGRHELGHRQVKQAHLVLYARALGVDVSELLPGTTPHSDELRQLMELARELPPAAQRKLLKIARTLLEDDDPPDVRRAA